MVTKIYSRVNKDNDYGQKTIHIGSNSKQELNILDLGYVGLICNSSFVSYSNRRYLQNFRGKVSDIKI